jgi:hypothetical protein
MHLVLAWELAPQDPVLGSAKTHTTDHPHNLHNARGSGHTMTQPHQYQDHRNSSNDRCRVPALRLCLPRQLRVRSSRRPSLLR